MADQDTKITEKKVCEKCGKVHETPIPDGEGGAGELKMIGLAAIGIVFIVLIWIWVFKWGVPLVKQLSGS